MVSNRVTLYDAKMYVICFEVLGKVADYNMFVIFSFID